MTKRVKVLLGVLVAVVAVAVSIFVSNPSMLQGRTAKPLPAYNENPTCNIKEFQNIYFYYSGGGTTSLPYKYTSFSDFAASIKNELSLYNGKVVCPYAFSTQGHGAGKNIFSSNPGYEQDGNLYITCGNKEITVVDGVVKCEKLDGNTKVSLEVSEKEGALTGKYSVTGKSFSVNRKLQGYFTLDVAKSPYSIQ